MSLLALFSLVSFSQENQKFNSNAPIQKTMQFENGVTKAFGILSFSKSYGLNENNTFEAKKEVSDKSGLIHQRHQQYYRGLKVEFGTLITHSRGGNLESINGELYNAKSLDLKPTLTAIQALDKAISFTNAQKYLWEDPESSITMEYSKPSGELLIFPMVNSGKMKLAYKFDIYAISPLSRNEVYLDAHSGEILYINPIIKHAQKNISNSDLNAKADEVKAKIGEAILLGETDKIEKSALNVAFAASTAATRYSGIRTIETNFTGTNYILQETTRTTNGLTGNGIRTYNSGRTSTYPLTDFTNVTTTWNSGNYATNSVTKDNAALDAHWGAEKVFDWWATVFNRNSYDDAGATIKSWVHYDNQPGGVGYDNAFWNGSFMTYGDGNSYNVLTSLDVCGHEIGHAVCTYTAGLAYQNHSGAMNEGLSDIWGSCIEWWAKNGNFNMPADGASPGTQAAWKIGEDIATGGLRSMSWPLSKGDPDTFKGTSWRGTSDDGVNCVPDQGANDYCGVHDNSGVLNHWFYLLTIGKTNWTNNASPTRTTTTTGIGMQKASQITYLAERDYLTPNATYYDMRNATITVAKNLFGCGSAEHIAVMNSWYAVNVGVRFTDVDLGISSITGDTNLNCGVSSYSVSFVLQNQGLPSISNANITYSIDGDAATPISWTGSALSSCTNATQNYTIPIGILSRGSHTVTVNITLAGDTDSSNNTKSCIVTINENGTVGVTNPFTNASDALVSVDYNGNTNSLWERGTINKTKLTSVATGASEGYATKLVGNYTDKTTSYLISQCYNLTNIANPVVSFDMAFDLEANWDIIYFEYSTNSGATWDVLGTSTDPLWYNSPRLPNGTDCFNCIGKQWTGDYATAPAGGTGLNGNKRTYSHTLTPFGNGGATPASNIIFRFTFVSDDSANQEGVFIDNFLVQGTLGTKENQFETFGVYPNPSNGKFNIVLSTSDKVNVQLFDIRGRSVFSKLYNPTGVSFQQEIDLSALSSGVYILNVESNGKKEAKRIIIE